MNPEQQIQMLIEQAPQYGANPTDVQTIAPALLTIASRLKHPQYFILQTLEQNWLMTTLTHRTQSNLTKNVVYAFPTLKDAAASPQAPNDPQVMALPIPVVQILFQMLAMKPVDSIVFFETPGNLHSGTEISRQNLQDGIRLYVQQQRKSSRLPPDMA
ncbi:hypothetical protein [Thermocoleostomius sinensis]|jgi:hypothetical protein|uniref:Uncharacterized protein n=1 Tax=Thermocoleostomius sinensis A174 TaxID=2016057 RepID=A0A9E9C965_9CYAN|nr:hypothetical protein [Thermocoleostomius sinensis]WAL59192.1 hypothetical protein OXH18_18730 [Thermocoleostomius sinensis A174]